MRVDPRTAPWAHITYVLTNQDYLHFHEYFLRTSEAFREEMTAPRIVGAVVAGVAVHYAGWLGDIDIAVRLGTAVLAGVAFWFGLPLVQRVIIKRQLTKLSRTAAIGDTGLAQLWMDAFGLHEDVNGVRTSFPWEVVWKVDEDHSHAYIFVSPKSAYLLPKHSASAGLLDFLALVRHRAGITGA